MCVYFTYTGMQEIIRKMEEEDVKSWCFYDEFDPMPASWIFMQCINVV